MDVFEYIVRLEKSELTAVLEVLYSNEWTTVAVFRSVPPLAQHIILRLLYTSNLRQDKDSFKAWVKSDRDIELEQMRAVKRLRNMKICAFKGGEIVLAPGFASMLKRALSHSGPSPWSDTSDMEEKTPSRDDLDRISSQAWDRIPYFLLAMEEAMEINCKHEDVTPLSSFLKDLIVAVDLIAKVGESENYQITSEGYKFLLKDRYYQIWILLLAYLETADETRGVTKGEILGFLFQMSFLTFGTGYPYETLSAIQKQILKDLTEFGLFYTPGTSNASQYSKIRYYPTRFSVNLVSQSGEEDVETNTATVASEEYIISETNYRLYAYTDSRLKIKILSLFCELLYRLPNMIVAHLSRDSVRNALYLGISADEIIDYLRKHTHPMTKKRAFPIPDMIQDQIRLWEAQRNRVSMEDGFFYDHFDTEEDFLRAEQYAKELEVHLWSSSKLMGLMVVREGHEDMKAFIRALSEKQ